MYNDFESLVLMSIIFICGSIICFIGHFVEKVTDPEMTEDEIELFEQFR
jgi:hypothetical protein